MKRTHWISLLLLAISLTFLTSACGDLDGGEDCDPEFDECEECDPDVEDCSEFDDNNNNNDSRDSQPRNITVTTANFAFSPMDVEAPAGSTITWVNDGRDQITVTISNSPALANSEAKTFDVTLNAGQRTSLTLRTPGLYTYSSRLQSFPGLTGATILIE